MANLYYDLIKKNLRVIDDVPIRWRADVQRLLDAEES